MGRVKPAPPPDDLHRLSPTVTLALTNMTPEQCAAFNAEYHRRRHGVATMLVLAVLLPVHWFVLRQWGVGIAYWGAAIMLAVTTGTVLVLIVWAVGVAVTPRFVRRRNDEIANEIVRDIRHATVGAG